MKRILTLCIAFMLCIGLAFTCMASTEAAEQVENGQDDEEWNVKEYVQEKIVPVAVGVITSVLALLATIGTVSRSLKSLSELKEGFGGEAKKRQEQFEKEAELFKEKAEELKAAVSDIPTLKEQVCSLTKECRLNSEILALGFSANPEIVKSGKGRKMSILLENAKCKMQNAELGGGKSCLPEEVSANETI